MGQGWVCLEWGSTWQPRPPFLASPLPCRWHWPSFLKSLAGQGWQWELCCHLEMSRDEENSVTCVQTYSCTVLYLVRTLHGWLNAKLARLRVTDLPSFTVALWKLIRERGWTNLCPWQGTSVPSKTAKNSVTGNGAIFTATRGQIKLWLSVHTTISRLTYIHSL